MPKPGRILQTCGCWLMVSVITWQCMVFDDSFDHEVIHKGTSDRVVLLVDVWHPDLVASEIAAMQRFLK